MRSHHGVNVRVLPRSIGNGPDRWGTRQSISNRFARCLVKRRMRFGKANRTGLRAVTHMSCVDTFNRRDEGYDHDNAEYDGKDNHDGSAGVSVCRLLRIVFHGCLPKGARNNVTWLSWFRLPGRQYPRRGGKLAGAHQGKTPTGSFILTLQIQNLRENSKSTGRTHGRTDQTRDVKISLANSEPSTHGTKPKCHPVQRMSADKGVTDYVRTSRIDADNPKATSVSANRSVGGE